MQFDLNLFDKILKNPKKEFTDIERIQASILLIVKYGGVDGSHHKNWVLDQTVRILAGKQYNKIVKEAKAGEDGPDTYEWDEGTPP